MPVATFLGRSVFTIHWLSKKVKSNPFKKLNAIFTSKEYQKERDDISHSHMVVELYFEQMTEDEKSFVDDIIQARVFDIVKTEEVDRFK